MDIATVLATRRSRSTVAPAAVERRLLFKIRGYGPGDDPFDAGERVSETIELRVVNTDGELQPAATLTAIEESTDKDKALDGRHAFQLGAEEAAAAA